jgi:type 1 fimbria pilin
MIKKLFSVTLINGGFMQLNKIVKCLALVACTASGLSSAAYAAGENTVSGLDQTLNISGSVTGEGCTVDFPSTIVFAESDISHLVSSQSAVVGGGVQPAQTPTLKLVNCDTNQKFTVTLQGTADGDDANVLANGSSNNPALHVGMAMFIMPPSGGSSFPQLAPAQPSSTYTYVDNQDGAGMDIGFFPQLVKTTASPTAGDVNITGSIQITYL